MQRKQKYVNNAIAFTQSSFAYKDPYQPKGNIIYKLQNKVRTFTAMRNFENEFVDFKTYHAQDQFKEIYLDLYKAYKRSDKVIMTRSLSEGMIKVSMFLFLPLFSFKRGS